MENILVKTPPPVYGTLIKRYKRFLADIKLDSGKNVTAHCPNSGRMTGCAETGFRAILSESENPNRKLKYTLELVRNNTCWICVNTNRANDLAYEAILKKRIPGLTSFDSIRREVKYGVKSRIDILGEKWGKKTYIEVKSVTLINHKSRYAFPDAPTERGRKHLHELMHMKKQGCEAIMLFIIMRSDGKGFSPAKWIDPEYADLLKKAKGAGVKLMARLASVTPQGLGLKGAERIYLL